MEGRRTRDGEERGGEKVAVKKLWRFHPPQSWKKKYSNTRCDNGIRVRRYGRLYATSSHISIVWGSYNGRHRHQHQRLVLWLYILSLLTAFLVSFPKKQEELPISRGRASSASQPQLSPASSLLDITVNPCHHSCCTRYSTRELDALIFSVEFLALIRPENRTIWQIWFCWMQNHYPRWVEMGLIVPSNLELQVLPDLIYHSWNIEVVALYCASTIVKLIS